jgi:hypothetical protein
MKTKTLMMSALFSMISAAAFAQNPVAQDSREIKHDNAVIAVKKGEVAAGKQQLQAERQETKALAHAEHQALKKGDIVQAKQLDQARHDEQHAVQQQKQAIKHDKKVIARHRVDKHEAQIAREEDKLKHEHEAGKI